MFPKFIKTAFFLLLVVTLFVPLKIYSQSSFEGKIKMKVTNGDNKSNLIDYYVKGSKYRFEMNDMEGKGYSIWDTDAKKMTVIMPAQKMYMEMPMDFSKMAQSAENDSNMEKMKEGMKNVKFTHRTKKIQGYDCEELVYKDGEDGESGEIWYTKELGSFLMTSSKNPFLKGLSSNDMPEDVKNLFKGGFFPMQAITKDKDGNVVSSMEVVGVDKESLGNDVFSVPDGYKKFDMPAMYNQMMKHN